MLQRAAASLCDGFMMAPKMLRLRSSSQMREVNTHGAAGGGVWLRPSVCVRAIGTWCRRGLNLQGSEVENLVRVTSGCVRDADRQTDRQAGRQTEMHLPKYSVLQTENTPTSLAGPVSIGASSPAVESNLGGVPAPFTCDLLSLGLSLSWEL